MDGGQLRMGGAEGGGGWVGCRQRPAGTADELAARLEADIEWRLRCHQQELAALARLDDEGSFYRVKLELLAEALAGQDTPLARAFLEGLGKVDRDFRPYG